MNPLISENFFTTLAKTLALGQLRKELPKAIKEMESEQDLASTLESLKYWTDKADAGLKKVCKDNPNSVLCKEKGTK